MSGERQCMVALARAQALRTTRASFKRQVAAAGRHDGSRLAAASIRQPAPWLAGIRSGDLVLAIPSVGPVKMQRLLRVCGLAPSQRLRGLTPEQRTRLADLVSGRATRGPMP